MTDRKRDPLPDGYQFGDAGLCRHTTLVPNEHGIRSCTDCGGVYEPDLINAMMGSLTNRTVVSNWRKETADLDRRAGLPPWPGWNVIEGDH